MKPNISILTKSQAEEAIKQLNNRYKVIKITSTATGVMAIIKVSPVIDNIVFGALTNIKNFLIEPYWFAGTAIPKGILLLIGFAMLMFGLYKIIGAEHGGDKK